MAVPRNANSDTVSTAFVKNAAGRPDVSPHAATSSVSPVSATSRVAIRRWGGIRCGEDTARRPSGSTHGGCLTSLASIPSLAAVWRQSGMWSKRSPAAAAWTRWWSWGVTGCRSTPAPSTASTPRTWPPSCRRSSTGWRSWATRGGAGNSAPACSSSGRASPWSRFSTPTLCSSSWCGRPPTWAPCSTTCGATARRSPGCSEPGSPALSPVRRHLLVVDDEPHIGLLLRPHLERLGYAVSLARTLAEARRAMQGGAPPFDALLLDLHLPDGSGLELLRELRAAAATRAFPVIVLTAEGEERILGEAESLGAGLLTKPFSPSKLTARIAALLGDAPPAPPAPPPPPSSPPSAPQGPR